MWSSAIKFTHKDQQFYAEKKSYAEQATAVHKYDSQFVLKENLE